MQMNCKLGGVPWMVKQYAKKTIIIGIDTYHDTGKIHRLYCHTPYKTYFRSKRKEYHRCCEFSQSKLRSMVLSNRYAVLKGTL